MQTCIKKILKFSLRIKNTIKITKFSYLTVILLIENLLF